MNTIREIHPGDAEWPDSLADLGEDQPTVLYLRGPLNLIEATAKSVAIVGARAATAYGGRVASDLSYSLAGRSYTVVSGVAYGIDALAHRGALAANGHTIAVVATGIDIPYPRSHDRLIERIGTEGLLVSEYEPGTNPRPERFLARNRIIAALTQGTVVVEAAARSGSLNTARRATELHRVVMAVPGPITSAMSSGTHTLIQSGAHLVTSAQDVITALEV